MSREHLKEEKSKYEDGASRSKETYSYHLIPSEAISLISDRFHLGARKHGENNWKKGGKDFIKQIFNHMMNHYVRELQNNYDLPQEDDNVAAMLWASAALAWFRVHRSYEYNQALLEMRFVTTNESDI